MSSSIKAEDLIKKLFDEILLDPTKYDQDIVLIIKKYFSSTPISSKSGEKISAELVQLVQKRISDGKIKKVE